MNNLKKMNQFCSQDTLPDFGTNLRILSWKPTNQATRKINLWHLMTYQPELSLRWNCNPRLFISVLLTYLIPVFEENNFHSQNRVRYVHTGQLKCTWNFKCSRQCLNRSRYIWLAILSYHGNLKPVSDTVNPRAKCHFTWCLPPLIRLSMVSYPDLSRSTGWAVFFLSWRSFTVPLFTRIKVTVCVLGMSAERAHSSAHSSLGKFRKSPQKKLLERVTRMIWTEKKQVYNQTQTSGYIFGLHREEK